MTAVSTQAGLRMLRSAPAMALGAVADAARVPARDLAAAVEQLQGRERCARLAASAMTFAHITEAKKRRILDNRACPPPVTLRSTWDPDIATSDKVPGIARWRGRSVDQPAAPRVAFTTDTASRVPGLHTVEHPHCPPAIAVALAAGPPERTERLAAVTPHPAALAALVTSTDDRTRRISADRGDLHPALAATRVRWRPTTRQR